ncbi:hypothetical protein K2173_015154 [Erythroxylum novogranatense]|uniref:SnoaL-like domain-containing protein n=1 Tax=Erythroxylum novogranatense TaxID=1862640 RepID=A0AAV8T1D7_9ROSI|nr:hypothetical protein K2173_015154 [Erythroxylum novogranatense]
MLLSSAISFHSPSTQLFSITSTYSLASPPPTATSNRRTRWTSKSIIAFSASENQKFTHGHDTRESASDIVRRFYEGINGRNLEAVENLIADNCVYEDLIFPRPFVGRQAILEFFEKFIDSISSDLQFVIDDISTEDCSAVGVTWHLEWNGKPFPFSKGCSFYRLKMENTTRQIIYGRDSVEPAIKPGDTALGAIRAVTWLLQQFPQLADRML